jgi:hypothetical protein
MFLNKFSDLYKRFERWISPVGLIYGFIFTSLTLTRVDTFLENFWIIFHLLIASFGILAVTLYENKANQKNLPLIEREKFHFFLTLIIQFAFGGLFSTFFVFYLRSSSIAQNWFFILLLLVLLIGNELWKKHYQRLAFQIIVLFVSLYLFFVFLLPVLFHRLGGDLFILGGILSLLIVFLFTLVLRKYALEKFNSNHKILAVSIVGIFVLMNILYFTNIIPPIPLAIKQVGVYHGITKVSSNSGTAVNYEVKSEATSWTDYFTRYPVFHKRAGESVYVFSAIFSPVNFTSKVIHQWQYYDEVKKEWLDSTKITLPITGGREEGYRLYSSKQAVTPGLWRVKVMTPSGQTLGNINFKVENSTTTPSLITKIL